MLDVMSLMGVWFGRFNICVASRRAQNSLVRLGALGRRLFLELSTIAFAQHSVMTW